MIMDHWLGILRDNKTEVANSKRLLGLARPYAGRLVVAAICLLVSGGIHLCFPYAMRILIDSVFVKHDLALLNRVLVLLVLAMAIGAVFNFLRYYHTAYVGERIVADLRVR